jgi:2-keto-4-pentenoate hydratase/2-oxohepta-3-ene-1,7-dioic acid hydratase in catechol pathway
MRFISFQSPSGPRAAIAARGGYIDLNAADPSLPVSLAELIAEGPAGLERAAAAANSGQVFDLAGAQLLPPIPAPQKILCVGLNYADHARETGKQPPEEPVIFAKLPTALSAHGVPIVLPRVSGEVDYEAELVVVIGRGGRNIPLESAAEHIAGYACGHDVSARDWQIRKPGGQWLLGKSFDSFAPCGPELVTADEVGDAGDLGMRLRLNGQVMQQSTTAQLIFSPAKLIAYISQVCSLSPGDLIYTGTPSGVGVARRPPVFLQPGDVVEVEIDRVGLLRNPVIAG